jgi:hypothetical protein
MRYSKELGRYDSDRKDGEADVRAIPYGESV